MTATTDNRSRMLVVPPGRGDQHWQPQPANGWIEVLTSPRIAGAPAGFSAGLQELPPLGKIREHAPPSAGGGALGGLGRALARLDGGAVRRIEAGTFMVAPPHARHGFINDGDVPFRFLWLLVPAGLRISSSASASRSGREADRRRTPPTEAGAIESATVFETLRPARPFRPGHTAPITDPSVLEALRREAVEFRSAS